MNLRLSPALPTLRLDVPLAPLLDIALARLARQTQYARALAKGGHKAATLRLWFDQASACLAALSRPRAFFHGVDTRIEAEGVRLADRVTLPDPTVVAEVARGGVVSAYLLTLGYGQRDAFDWLGGDYSAHHVQSDLGNEVLFALGRHVHAQMRAEHPAHRLRRVPIQAHGLCGHRQVWDPARVQALLSVFDGADTGVTVTDTGCFEPLNSLLGVTVRSDPAARGV